VSPTSTAELVDGSASVFVAPPLFPSAPRFGSVLDRLPEPVSPQVVPLSRLWPRSVKLPPLSIRQFGPAGEVPPAKIVLRTSVSPDGLVERRFPPSLVPVF
jgi:hypothetical protein